MAADEKLAQVQWNDRDLLQGLQQAEKTLAEQSDWNAVARGNQDVLTDFLARHPDGAMAGEARQALVALKEKTALTRERAEQALAALRSREIADASNAVTAMLQRYVNAWNTKDVASITALHRSLDRRTIKAQLAAGDGDTNDYQAGIRRAN